MGLDLFRLKLHRASILRMITVPLVTVRSVVPIIRIQNQKIPAVIRTIMIMMIQRRSICYSMFYQYPKECSMDLYDVEGSLVSENDVNYNHVKGNDISEILQIKEYMKGDSIKNIHWKMSAKMGKTMVKELDTPNDNSVMIFIGLQR